MASASASGVGGVTSPVSPSRTYSSGPPESSQVTTGFPLVIASSGTRP